MKNDFNIWDGVLFKYYGTDTSVIIPDNVTNIDDRVFYYSSLTSIVIPDRARRIGDLAFAHCTSLTSITIPDSVTIIGDMAFYGCSNLKTYQNRFFKATNGDMQCKGFQYELGKTYKTDKAELCKCGFHACRSPLDIFNYYHGEIGKDVRMFEVELKGATNEITDDSKRVGTEITFLRELTISELAELASEVED